YTLKTSAKIRAVGLGTWLPKPDEVERAVDDGAIRNTGNEEETGKGIKNSGVPREGIFLATGSKPQNHPRVPGGVEKGLDQTLKELRIDYLDLYLIR
ncbi:NADP-dependent oxidoreductase domain-containing protein, partial [Tuber brumale]